MRDKSTNVSRGELHRQREKLWHEEANRNIPANKNDKQNISKRVTKKRGTSKKEAERRAWATVNKESGGGKKSGSGRGKKESKASSRKGGRKGGRKKKR